MDTCPVAYFGIAWAPPLQVSVNRYCAALKTARKLLNLHPRGAGHPADAAALSPAIVLGVTGAFEGFAEDFTASALASQGLGFAEIAKKIGGWNNPTLFDFQERSAAYFPSAASSLKAGLPISTVHPSNGRIGVPRPWSAIVGDSRAWMQVRHNLTHGQTTGWRSEYWSPPLKTGEPHASTVLLARGATNHSLTLYGAISCARIYSIGAKTIADGVAVVLGQSLDWSELPDFR